jgi:hypothetical protein
VNIQIFAERIKNSRDISHAWISLHEIAFHHC